MFKAGDKVRLKKSFSTSDISLNEVKERNVVGVINGRTSFKDIEVYFTGNGCNVVAWYTFAEAEEDLEKITDDKADTSNTVNPKEKVGLSKLPLHLWSPLASAYGSLGLLNGQKYGFGNYKATPVLLSIYIAAALRHLYAFNEGQENDPVDGCPHLAAILANIAIILEARSVGTLIDDRPLQGGYLKEVEKLSEIARGINEVHKDRKAHHYTIKDNTESAIK